MDTVLLTIQAKESDDKRPSSLIILILSLVISFFCLKKKKGGEICGEGLEQAPRRPYRDFNPDSGGGACKHFSAAPCRAQARRGSGGMASGASSA